MAAGAVGEAAGAVAAAVAVAGVAAGDRRDCGASIEERISSESRARKRISTPGREFKDQGT